jgi:hypothetical protein
MARFALSSIAPRFSRLDWLFGRREHSVPARLTSRTSRKVVTRGTHDAAGRGATFSGLSASKLAGLIATGRNESESGGVFWLAIDSDPTTTFLGNACEFELELF